MLWQKYCFYVVSCLMLVWASAAYAVDKVDINTADVATLDRVMDGIGVKKAEAIVKYRQENGLFKSIQDLENVSGIGAKTIAKNKDKLIVSVDVNQADAETLVKMLDGISTEFATALVEYRGKHGSFKSIDEIAQVPGLTKEAFERNKERIAIIIPKVPKSSVTPQPAETKKPEAVKPPEAKSDATMPAVTK
jgi:competence protein ComEA